jgi:beta-glucosidase
VTFYKSVNDLPAFDDYRMAGRTYRFFEGQPLYPFGHGLSYTKFAYSNLRTSAPSLTSNGTLTVRVDVKNTGARSGDEVVQLYVQHAGSKVDRPKQDLRGYVRVSLKPGETKTVSMPLAAKSIAYWDSTGHKWVTEAEPINLRVGASSADIRLTKTINVTK